MAAASVMSAASTESVLHNFGSGKDGATPFAGLIFDKQGRLYGTTALGGCCNGGIVFKLTPDRGGQWTETILHNFQNNGKDGYWPYAGLIFDTDGNLYGTTTRGGSSDQGAIFQLTPDADGKWAERILYSFGGSADGSNPYAGLTFDAAGRLYGTTYYGGNSDCGGAGCGTVFQLSRGHSGDWKGQWTEVVLHRFDTNGNDGIHPYAGVIFDAAGSLYGTTVYGPGEQGQYLGAGTAYQLIPGRLTSNTDSKWTERVIYKFCLPACTGDGINPYGGLIFDAAGDLYGTTVEGGAQYSNGAAFELIRTADDQWSDTILDSFSQNYNFANGENPYDSLVLDAAGDVYGTTWAAGNLDSCGGIGCGTVFQLTPNPSGAWNQNILYTFSGEDGGFSYAGLIFDAEGNLYGTTSGGGTSGSGTVFQIIP